MTTTIIAYARVSTQKQEEQSVSLQEQRYAITNYAQKHQLRIDVWHEETVTAGKLGRKEFAKVSKLVNSGQGKTGLLMHKIDRGARNLKDWAAMHSGDKINDGLRPLYHRHQLCGWRQSGCLTACENHSYKMHAL